MGSQGVWIRTACVQNEGVQRRGVINGFTASFEPISNDHWSKVLVDYGGISSLVKQQMTNANVEKKEKNAKKTNHTLQLTVTKNEKSIGNKRVFTKTILTYGKDVTMSSGTQTTEVLLRWKYVRQAVERALCTLEQFTISEAELFRYITCTCRRTKTKASYFTKRTLILLICWPVRKPPESRQSVRTLWRLRNKLLVINAVWQKVRVCVLYVLRVEAKTNNVYRLYIYTKYRE